ncbi:MAG: helix-turn-helix transcriptional regulator [Clostridia bacterium]|nr:helix-turn-helix transcriptional regulator [Clostridia bacterium]
MKLNDAVYMRICELCNERNISIYRLAKDGGIQKTTLYQIRDCQTIKLDTIAAVCETLNISLGEFFSSSLFDPNTVTT